MLQWPNALLPFCDSGDTAWGTARAATNERAVERFNATWPGRHMMGTAAESAHTSAARSRITWQTTYSCPAT
jgi:hypothetical protein